MLETVRAGGNVLLPIDTAGRVLELMLMLDQEWRDKQLGQYKLVLLHHMAHNVRLRAPAARASGVAPRAAYGLARVSTQAGAAMWGFHRCGSLCTRWSSGCHKSVRKLST